MDPRIRIRTKMSWITNTALSFPVPIPGLPARIWGSRGGDLLDAVDVKTAGVLLDGRLAGGTALPVILVLLHPHLHMRTVLQIRIRIRDPMPF